MTKTSIFALALMCGGLYAGTASAQTATATTIGEFEKASGDLVAGSVISTDRRPDHGDAGGHYPDKPEGVPTELHRKVVKLYKRIKNAHPDAAPERIFNRIGEHLGVDGQRLWNAYRNDSSGPQRPDVNANIVDERVEQADAPLQPASPGLVADRGPDRGGAGYPDKPEGVPTELHRKVVQLYKRIHNAYPDASRKRIFQKIGQELGVNPRRLWNAYHTPRDPNAGPPTIDVRPVDAAHVDPARVDTRRDTRSRDARPADARRTDRVRDRRVRDRRATRRPPARVRRDRPARPARPQRGR